MLFRIISYEVHNSTTFVPVVKLNRQKKSLDKLKKTKERKEKENLLQMSTKYII